MTLLLILESFGTSELLVILVVALIFFGPRKLPQLSRQIGKSLAEFRKASEDFKRTWEREVALETTQPEPTGTILPRESSIAETTVGRAQPLNALPADGYVAQGEPRSTAIEAGSPKADHVDDQQPISIPKRDWL